MAQRPGSATSGFDTVFGRLLRVLPDKNVVDVRCPRGYGYVIDTMVLNNVDRSVSRFFLEQLDVYCHVYWLEPDESGDII